LDDGTNTEIQAAFSHCAVLLGSLLTHVLATYCVTVWLGADLVPAPKPEADKAAEQDVEARLSMVWIGGRSVLDLKRL
jgi:hypothetical protein